MQINREMDYSLFNESPANHQRLVDILDQYSDVNGVAIIPKPNLARLVNRSQSWITQAIKRINTEDICIEVVTPGKYILHYTNLLEQGVFAKIMRLILEYHNSPEMFYERDSVMASSRGLRLKTIQMFKAYLQTRHGTLLDVNIL